LRRDVPRGAAADAARSPRHPARARVRRADDRGGVAHAARARTEEARGDRRLVEIEYQKEGEETSSTRSVEPYVLERELPNWTVHTWDRTRDGERSFRLDRMREAKLLSEQFEPREGFEPSRLRDARTARVL